MSNKIQINTRVRRLISYIQDLEEGNLQIPEFQRDFIWEKKDKLDLFDSLKRGYPIGSILFWQPKTNEDPKRLEKIGPFTVPEPSNNFFYVLDGFQRLSTLLGCLINPQKAQDKGLQFDEKTWEDEFKLYYDLKEEVFIIPKSNIKDMAVYQIPTYELIDTPASFTRAKKMRSANLSEEEIELYTDRYITVGSKLIDYQLPSIDIVGGEIEEVVDIFSRVNSKGSIISPDWIASALSYNKEEGFRLGSLISNLISKLSIYNFQTIKRDLVLNCLQTDKHKLYLGVKIKDFVKKPNFIEDVTKKIVYIEKAIHFLYEELLVVDARLLPANRQLVFMTQFFEAIPTPTEEQIKALKKWFWITTYSNYFTIYSPSQVIKAYTHFQRYLNGEEENMLYNDAPSYEFEVRGFPQKIYFGSVRSKGFLLFLLNQANNFEKISSEKIEGLHHSFLFYDLTNPDNKDNYYSESVLPTLRYMNGSNFPKSKDMAFLLSDFKDEYAKYFLNEEMAKIWKKGDTLEGKMEILRLRKEWITTEERKFVEDLGMEYVI